MNIISHVGLALDLGCSNGGPRAEDNGFEPNSPYQKATQRCPIIWTFATGPLLHDVVMLGVQRCHMTCIVPLFLCLYPLLAYCCIVNQFGDFMKGFLLRVCKKVPKYTALTSMCLCMICVLRVSCTKCRDHPKITWKSIGFG